MHMRKSKVMKTIREGKTALCTKMNLSEAKVAELAAMSGVDCIWIDMEHGPIDYLAVENIIRAAKIYDVDVMTRVAKGSYNDFIRPFEADSTGIMVPHLMNYEEAKQIVYYTKFHPIGRRPIDGGNIDGSYCKVGVADYIKEANEERFVVVQIEDPEPMAELEEICQLPGLDMIFFGPADFSQGIGNPTEVFNEETLKARRKVAETARKYGKIAGTVGSAANFKDLEAEGFNFINAGADVLALGMYWDDIVKQIRG